MVHHPQSQWLKLLDRKLYYKEMLSVLSGLDEKLITMHHSSICHVVPDRTFKEASRWYVFPPTFKVRKRMKQIKYQCQVGKATEPPNWQTHLKIRMKPISSHFA